MPATSRLAALLIGMSLLALPPVATAEDAPPDANESTTAVAEGSIRIGANQPGATVWIDDKEVGKAPMVRKVPVGPHRIRVAAAEQQYAGTRRVVLEHLPRGHAFSIVRKMLRRHS